jgi:hypothetical protein
MRSLGFRMDFRKNFKGFKREGLRVSRNRRRVARRSGPLTGSAYVISSRQNLHTILLNIYRAFLVANKNPSLHRARPSILVLIDLLR